MANHNDYMNITFDNVTFKYIEKKILDGVSFSIDINNKIGVVVQTTQTLSTLKPIIDYLETLTDNLLVMNTICPSTSKRQNEVEELAANNDLIIIVGSKNSANTTHLADIARKVTNTIHIESADELKKYSEIIDKSLKIGVSAGASTPQNIISDVVTKLKGGNL